MVSGYMAVIEGRIKRQRQEIGKCQAQIMQGRSLKANRELIAKCQTKIDADKKIIDVNTKEV
jgi:hypothetical protein